MPVLLFAVIVAVFWPVRRHQFLLWDDGTNVYQNPYVLDPAPRAAGHFWTEAYEGLYIPVTYSAWWCLARLAGAPKPGTAAYPLEAGVFHMANVLLHALSALTVFAILSHVVRRRFGGQPAGGAEWHAAVAAGLGALLFGLHPIQAEAVAWVTGLKDVLCGLLCLVAVWQYVVWQAGGGGVSGVRCQACPPETPGTRSPLPHAAAATAAFVLALLAKPAAVVTPVLALVVTALALGAKLSDKSFIRRNVLLAGWLAVSAVWVGVTKAVQTTQGLDVFGPLWARPLVAGDAVTFYLTKLVAPVSLGIDYGRTPGAVLGSGLMWVTGLLPYGLAAGLWFLRKRLPWLVAAGAVFAIGVLPVLGFVPFAYQRISTVADRYVYISMLGPAMLLAWLMRLRPKSGAAATGILAACALALAALAARTVRQLPHWRDDDAVFAHAIAVNPRSSISQNNLGLKLWAQGRKTEAMARYRKAIAANPRNVKALDNLGVALADAGQTREAIDLFRRAVEQSPRNIPCRLHLGDALETIGRYEEALEHYYRAAEVSPDFALAQYHIAKALLQQGKTATGMDYLRRALQARHDFSEELAELADALNRQGKGAVAIELYGEILARHPHSAQLHYRLANLLAGQKRTREAVAHYSQALAREPSFARAHYNLANTYAGSGAFDRAAAHYREAVRAEPSFTAAYNNLANSLVKQGAYAEAVGWYEKVLEREPDNADARGNLEAVRKAMGK